jgi:prophage antirepressor-like protein
MNDTVIYNNGEIELKVSLEKDTIWLTQKQIVEIFDSSKANISEHITFIFQSFELDKDSTVRKFRTVQKEGNREVARDLEHYNLDVIISVGYRVNSIKATKFRQWATSVLKQYITNGYTINSDKITHQRFKELEGDVALLKSKVNLLEDKTLKPSQGIFFDGQVFDAYEFVSGLVKNAKREIVLIDNYIDESVLTLFSKNQEIDVIIYSKTITKQLKLDLQKYNAQYRPITVKSFKEAHDRFMIIDETDVYHFGASLKDLGKKWFAFSKMDRESITLLNNLNLEMKGK